MTKKFIEIPEDSDINLVGLIDELLHSKISITSGMWAVQALGDTPFGADIIIMSNASLVDCERHGFKNDLKSVTLTYLPPEQAIKNLKEHHELSKADEHGTAH